jgi:hypothetical protein
MRGCLSCCEPNGRSYPDSCAPVAAYTGGFPPHDIVLGRSGCLTAEDIPWSYVQSCSSLSSRRCTSSLLRLTLLLNQHLLSQDLLDHPQVVRLAVDHVLKLLDVAR